MSGLCTCSCHFTNLYTLGHICSAQRIKAPLHVYLNKVQRGLVGLHYNCKEAFLTTGSVSGKLAQGHIQSTILQYYLAYPSRYF